MQSGQYSALEILKKGCALIPKDFTELVADPEDKKGYELRQIKSEHLKMKEAVAQLTKLFAMKKEDLRGHYNKLSVSQHNKIRSAVDTVHLLLSVALEKEQYYPENYTIICDAMRLLACYFPVQAHKVFANKNPLQINSPRVCSSFSKEHMLTYAAICNTALINNYSAASSRRPHLDGLLEPLLREIIITSTRDLLFYGTLATVALLGKKTRKVHMGFILLVTLPFPVMHISQQSRQEKETSFLLMLAGTVLSFILYTGAVLMSYIVDKYKYQIDPQKELFFKSLLPLKDEKKDVKTNTAGIFKELSIDPQPPQPVQKKNSTQQKENGVTKYTPVIEPRELKTTIINVQPAPPEQTFRLSS